MSLLVRKIDSANWAEEELKKGADVPADAVTTCLRTKGNALSFWEIDSLSDIDDAVLAIVAGYKHLEMIDVVAIDPQLLSDGCVKCIATEGQTPVRDLLKEHRELVMLTCNTLGIVARSIAEAFKQDHVYMRTKEQLKSILKDAITAGRLSPDKLKITL